MTEQQQYPTREQIAKAHQFQEDSAGDGHTSPREWWTTCSCGASLTQWQQGYDENNDDPNAAYAMHIADVVLALFPQPFDSVSSSSPEGTPAVQHEETQPTPSAEPTAWEQAAQIAERDAGSVTLADLTQFPAVQSTGARIAFNIRAAAQKNGPVTADVLQSRGPHPKVTVLGRNENSLPAGMVPGTTFWGHLSSFPTRTPLLLVTVGYMTVCKVRSGEMYSALDVDSSTIRDVTPPPATPEVN